MSIPSIVKVALSVCVKKIQFFILSFLFVSIKLKCLYSENLCRVRDEALKLGPGVCNVLFGQGSRMPREVVIDEC
jgi:hypothetical protein